MTAIILMLALVVNMGVIMLFEFLNARRWRYRGRNIKERVRAEMDAKWLKCSSARICRYCGRRDKCTVQCVELVKAEIDAEIQEVGK